MDLSFIFPMTRLLPRNICPIFRVISGTHPLENRWDTGPCHGAPGENKIVLGQPARKLGFRICLKWGHDGSIMKDREWYRLGLLIKTKIDEHHVCVWNYWWCGGRVTEAQPQLLWVTFSLFSLHPEFTNLWSCHAHFSMNFSLCQVAAAWWGFSPPNAGPPSRHCCVPLLPTSSCRAPG